MQDGKTSGLLQQIVAISNHRSTSAKQLICELFADKEHG